MPAMTEPVAPMGGPHGVPPPVDASAAPGAVDPALAEAIDQASVREALQGLVDDARATVDSELALWKASGAVAAEGAKTVSLWGVAAVILLFVAVLTLAIGIMIALIPIVGPWLAALIVPAVLLLLTAIAALKARSGVTMVKDMLASLKP